MPAIRSLLKKDSIRGHRVLEAWQYSLLNSDSKGLEDFETLEDYEEFRVMNSGMLYVTRCYVISTRLKFI